MSFPAFASVSVMSCVSPKGVVISRSRRIDASSVVKTKDDRKVKLHVLAVTTRRAKSSQQKYMRQVINDLLAETAAEKSFDELIKLVVNGKLASEVYHNAKKIYPLKRVEIIKSKVLN